jgi:hypothetical protein
MGTNSTSTRLGPTSVIPVPKELVGYYWPIVGPLLQRAIEESNNELDLDWVYAKLQASLMQLLVAVEADRVLAAFVTEVVNYPNKRALRLVLGGGSGTRKWREQLHNMLHIGARAVEAHMIELYGRAGWIKMLSVFPGVRVKYYVLTEDIE